MTESERPPISVTVSTVQGWPEIAPNLKTVVESVRAVGGEVVLTDGSGNPAPSPEEVGPGVVWLSYPGESVFQLRDRGYKAARGRHGLARDRCEPVAGKHPLGRWARRVPPPARPGPADTRSVLPRHGLGIGGARLAVGGQRSGRRPVRFATDARGRCAR